MSKYRLTKALFGARILTDEADTYVSNGAWAAPLKEFSNADRLDEVINMITKANKGLHSTVNLQLFKQLFDYPPSSVPFEKTDSCKRVDGVDGTQFCSASGRLRWVGSQYVKAFRIDELVAEDNDCLEKMHLRSADGTNRLVIMPLNWRD